jgi:hypothetical protein
MSLVIDGELVCGLTPETVGGRDISTGELYRFGLTPIEGNGFE